MVRRADAASWRDLLDANGYQADIQFNALHGAQRLLHFDLVHERQLDTFVSNFAMCHSLDHEHRVAGRRLAAPQPARLPQADQISQGEPGLGGEPVLQGRVGPGDVQVPAPAAAVIGQPGPGA